MDRSNQPFLPASGLLFAVAPVFAYVAMQCVLWIFGAKPIFSAIDAAVADVLSRGDFGWSEAASRLTLLGLMFLFEAGLLGLVIKTAHDFANLFDHRSRLYVAAFVVVVAVLSALTVVPGGAGLIPRYRTLVGEGVFNAVVTANAATGVNWGQGEVDASASIMTVSITVAIACLGLQLISCVGVIRSIGAAESWKFQFDRMKFYTYLSSVFMIVGLLMNRAWLSYPLFLFSDGLALQSFNGLVSAFTMYLGIAYTVIIGSISVPVACYLYFRANTIAAAVAGVSMERHQAPYRSVLLATQRQSVGLLITPQDVFKSLIAVLGPFVAGSVSALPAFT